MFNNQSCGLMIEYLNCTCWQNSAISPHRSAKTVKRLFSDLCGTQTVKCCNFSVNTFETLSKLRSNYFYHVYQDSKSSRCWEARSSSTRSHTRKDPASMLIWQRNSRPTLLRFHLLLLKLHMLTRLIKHLTVLRKRWPRRD